MRYTRYSLCDYVPGDLIPRHQQVFSNNQFFCGVSIPELQQMVTTSFASFISVRKGRIKIISLK